MSWGRYIIIQYITVHIKFLLSLYKEGAGEVFLQIPDMHYI